MRSFYLGTLVSTAVIVSVAAPLPALATDNGLAYVIHTIKREGNKSCMVGHYHFGDATSDKSKAAALKAAKRKWASFVRLEYGSSWSNHRLSANKGQKCTKRGKTYSCSVSARPCKR